MDIELFKPFKLIFKKFQWFGMWQDGEQTWAYFIFGYLLHLLLLKKIKKSYDELKDLLQSTNYEESVDRKTLKKEIAFCYKVYLAFWSSALVTCASGAFVPFLSSKLPYKVWFPFDVNKETNEIGFWIASLYLIFHSFIVSTLDITLDIFPVVFMAFSIGLLNEFSQRLSKIESNGDLIQCIIVHKKIKHFVNGIHANFATAIFFQGVTSSLTLCTGVLTMTFTTNLTQLIRIVTFIVPMVLEIFLPCYFGNELSIASSHLTTSIFQSKLIEGDQKLKKTAIIFTECNRKELKITSLGLFDLHEKFPLRIQLLNIQNMYLP
ncbi:CLUMA_CG016009, isoform A [Clunio marinus]|uniref:CLUMA_CG016009, isoform A n=1 Tax=Clunio marinus TaxID=568069 RepID=A0A1J1IUG7_9DIPT|nr:CLUMA_CG016009, isoform A [Clunio marinus]